MTLSLSLVLKARLLGANIEGGKLLKNNQIVSDNGKGIIHSCSGVTRALGVLKVRKF